MFGGSHSGKFGGRGGGRGAGPSKRSSLMHQTSSSPFRTPPQHLSRPSSRPPSSGGTVTNNAEESFRLETSSPLNFGMIIRLAPDMVDEIKRVQTQGLSSRIKFDYHPNNSSGNVIDVGGKEFRFMWSSEPGDLCDIYEEHRSGDSGCGLLVESGSAWRKLNVPRKLDESTRDHVKMRSEEAERLQKSRKAIVLDTANPSVKNHGRMLAAASVDVNNRRMHFKSKKAPLQKKQKVEPAAVLTTASAPSKPVQKSGTSAAILVGKLGIPGSPVPSPMHSIVPLQASASPNGTVNAHKGLKSSEDAIGSQIMNSSSTPNSEKDASGRIGHDSSHELANTQDGLGLAQMDLRSFLISVLMENPKGMTLKAIEKLVADTIPHHGKKLETTIKTIANYGAPGRYFLKEEKEITKRPSLEPERSPIYPSNAHSAGSTFTRKMIHEESCQPLNLIQNSGEPITLTNSERHHESPGVFDGSQKVMNNETCSSSSDSRSASESDSSDSGSISRSKSRSPVSGSSSDSESDGSSSSHEGSDVHVDIMKSDDDDDDSNEGLHGSQSPDTKVEASQKNDNDCGVHDELGLSSERLMSDVDLEAENEDDFIDVVEPGTVSYITNSLKENLNQNLQLTPKKEFSLNSSNNFENCQKREKNSVSDFIVAQQATMDRMGTPGTVSVQKLDMVTSTSVANSNIEMDIPSSQNFQRKARREEGLQMNGNIPPSTHRKGRDATYSVVSHGSPDDILVEDSMLNHIVDDNIPGKVVDSLNKPRSNNLKRKNGEQSRKVPDEEKVTTKPYTSNLSNDSKSAVNNEKKASLTREYSDLELGEFRECSEDARDHTGQLDKSNSFRNKVENKVDFLEAAHPDAGYRKGERKGGANSVKISPEISDHDIQGSMISQSVIRLSESESLNYSLRQQQNASVNHHPTPTNQVNGDYSSRSGRSSHAKNGEYDVKGNRVLPPGDHGGYDRRDSTSILHQRDAKIPSSVGAKTQQVNQYANLASTKADISQDENNIDRKRACPSFDEQTLFSAYDKEKAEFKEPIQTDFQYKEYTREYCEKYSDYCNLNNALQDDRAHFQKLGSDLELAKDKDKDAYANAVTQLRSAYRQCIERHKRMKKVFVVLHEELKQLKKRIKDYAAAYTRESSAR